jgi:uncharacterized membrane protein
MPSLAYYHPVVVHFAVALIPVGLILRVTWVLFARRPAFAHPAAALLLVLGAIATAFAVKSGNDAHGPVEHLPGGGPPLGAHRQWGERARNIALGVAALEIAAMALTLRRKDRAAFAAAAVAGATAMGATYCAYRAGKTGGALVYDHAGGVGIRSGDAAGLDHLLIAGVVQASRADRARGRKAEAADLLALAARRFPDDPEVLLLAAESLLVDRGDAAGALSMLRRLDTPEAAPGVRFQRRLLTADALVAAGQREEALTTLRQMRDEYPRAGIVRQRLEALEKGLAPPR